MYDMVWCSTFEEVIWAIEENEWKEVDEKGESYG
jgi:hypothetical protein